MRAKIDRTFVFLGNHELKNISAPVPVYRIADLGDLETPTDTKPAPAAPPPASEKQRHTVFVVPFQLISGGDELKSLAAGLYQDILNGLTRQSALNVIGGARPDDTAAEFRLEGSLRAAGERLRLSFSLSDTGAQRQIWAERYDRQLSDVFDLEDEISRNVASAVRLRIKAGAFEKLRNTPNEALSVPELLSKAAGLFVESYGHNDEAADILTSALARQPNRSMTHAMLVFCRYRACEFSAFALSEQVITGLLEQSHQALSIDNASYFAHLMAALIHHDLRGDFTAARVHAETALGLNPGFTQAMAMAGVTRIHLGEVADGVQMLKTALEAAPEDPHRFRHLRELALGYLVGGDPARAAETIDKLIHQAPDLLRNELVAAPVFWQVGREADAKQRIARLLAREPGVTLATMRPLQIGAGAVADRIRENLVHAGLPA